MISFFRTIILILIIISQVSFGYTSSLSFDSGMIAQSNSSRGIAEFNLDFISTTNRLFIWGHDSNGVTRTFLKGYFLMNYFFPYHLGSMINLSYHELGHYNRIIATGQDAYYQVVYSFDSGENGPELHNYFDLFYSILTNPNISGARVVSSGTKYAHLTDDSSRYNALISANGVNSEMYFSAKLSDRNYSMGQGIIFDYFTYQKAKLSLYEYVKAEEDEVFGSGGGDLTTVRSFYETEYGLDLTYDQLKLYSLASYFTSAQTWAYIGAVRKYFYNDQIYFPVSPTSGFRLPEVDFYLNMQGPSYQVRSQYEYDDSTSFPFAIEYVFIGEPCIEYTVGYNKFWTPFFKTKTELRVGKDVGFSQVFSYDLNYNFRLGSGWVHYSGHNLFGARHAPSFAQSNLRSDEIFVFGQYLF